MKTRNHVQKYLQSESEPLPQATGNEDSEVGTQIHIHILNLHYFILVNTGARKYFGPSCCHQIYSGRSMYLHIVPLTVTGPMWELTSSSVDRTASLGSQELTEDNTEPCAYPYASSYTHTSVPS